MGNQHSTQRAAPSTSARRRSLLRDDFIFQEPSWELCDDWEMFHADVELRDLPPNARHVIANVRVDEYTQEIILSEEEEEGVYVKWDGYGSDGREGFTRDDDGRQRLGWCGVNSDVSTGHGWVRCGHETWSCSLSSSNGSGPLSCGHRDLQMSEELQWDDEELFAFADGGRLSPWSGAGCLYDPIPEISSVASDADYTDDLCNDSGDDDDRTIRESELSDLDPYKSLAGLQTYFSEDVGEQRDPDCSSCPDCPPSHGRRSTQVCPSHPSTVQQSCCLQCCAGDQEQTEGHSPCLTAYHHTENRHKPETGHCNTAGVSSSPPRRGRDSSLDTRRRRATANSSDYPSTNAGLFHVGSAALSVGGSHSKAVTATTTTTTATTTTAAASKATTMTTTTTATAASKATTATIITTTTTATPTTTHPQYRRQRKVSLKDEPGWIPNPLDSDSDDEEVQESQTKDPDVFLRTRTFPAGQQQGPAPCGVPTHPSGTVARPSSRRRCNSEPSSSASPGGRAVQQEGQRSGRQGSGRAFARWRLVPSSWRKNRRQSTGGAVPTLEARTAQDNGANADNDDDDEDLEKHLAWLAMPTTEMQQLCENSQSEDSDEDSEGEDPDSANDSLENGTDSDQKCSQHDDPTTSAHTTPSTTTPTSSPSAAQQEAWASAAVPEAELDWLCEPEWNNLEMELFWSVLRPHLELLLLQDGAELLPEPCHVVVSLDSADRRMLDRCLLHVQWHIWRGSYRQAVADFHAARRHFRCCTQSDLIENGKRNDVESLRLVFQRKRPSRFRLWI